MAPMIPPAVTALILEKSIGTNIPAVAGTLATLAPYEPVSQKCADDFAGGDCSDFGKIDWHGRRSDGDCDAGTIKDLDVVRGDFGERLAILTQLVHDHLDDFIDVGEGFCLSCSLGDGSKVPGRIGPAAGR